MRGTDQIKRQAKRLFRLCLSNGLLDQDRTRQLVQDVIQSGRRGHLALLSQFQRLVRLDHLEHTAEVESAVPLTADVRASVLAHLEEMYGSGLTTLFRQTPTLIAGMRIQVGSDVYDSSVQFKLIMLEKSFWTTG